MSEVKNIKRNSTRPPSSRAPYIQGATLKGKKSEKKEIELMEKLASFK